MSAPISIKLRCASWQQLASIYKRDLSRNAIFLKSANPPPLGTSVRIDLTLPSESMVVLTGTISRQIAAGELEGRGPGVDVRLNVIPQSAMWLIETALASAEKEQARSDARRTGATQALGAPARGATPPAGTQAARPPPPRALSDVEAAIGDGSDVSSAETELIVALTSELDSLKRLNPFQVLGLGYEASDGDVRGAFGDLTKRYHPDRYARFHSPDVRNLAAEIFILIRDAYRRLGDENGRAQVVASLGPRRTAALPPAPRASTLQPPAMTPPPPSTGPARPAPRPPPPVQVPQPQPQPPPPTNVPSDGGGGMAMAESMLDSGKYDEALSLFKLLSKKNPGDRLAKAGIELAEGMRAIAMRDRLEAAQRFEAVLELDPANERAARELAEMRRLATNERKGMLSRLLGKKD